MLRTCHLFAGAGGGLLADLILGHQPVVAVEWDKYCCQVLRERAEDGWFPGLHVWEGDVRLFDPSEYAGRVDCIHAGFPCQDISSAGKGEGITGSRSGLVSEVFRAIDAIQPKFVMLENSPRIRTRGRDYVIGQLVARGYAWRDGRLAASDVGASHIRDRWWCVAANHDGLRELQPQRCKQNKRRRTNNSPENNADIMQAGSTNGSRKSTAETQSNKRSASYLESWKRLGTHRKTWFEIEPQVERLVYGLADGVVPAAIGALGNGQVPLQAAVAWKILSGEIGE